MSKTKSYWNYRMIAEYQDSEKEALRGWFFSIRDVYYTDDKPTSWGAEPQYPVGEEAMGVFNDLENMTKGVHQPLLIVQGDKLVEFHRKSSAFIKPQHLKQYEPSHTPTKTDKQVCQHEYGNMLYTSNPPQYRCTKCGEFICTTKDKQIEV